MSSRFLCTLLASVCALASLCPATADAQIGRRFVNRAEGPVVARGRNLIGRIIERRRARFLGAEAIAAEQQAAAYASQTRKPVPQPNGIRQAPGIQQTSATQSLKPLRPLPTKAQLAAMDESALWAAWRDTTELLDEQLSSLTTAVSWQQHLSTTRALRGELTALPNESKDGAFQNLLARFDNVSTNEEFLKISGQLGFVASHSALHEIVTRFASRIDGPIDGPNDGPKLRAPTGGKIAQTEPESGNIAEILPTPSSVADEPQGTQGERSILKRR